MSSAIPFTQELRSSQRLSDAELKNLQFFIRGGVTLVRMLGSNDRVVSDAHRLVFREGRQIEEIEIPDGTPCVLEIVAPNMVHVRFEPGFDAQQLLPFWPRHGDAQGVYRLGMSEKKRLQDLVLEWKVRYEGIDYDVSLQDGECVLMLDARQLKDIVRNRRSLPGVRLN
jgi:hypothetical protein